MNWSPETVSEIFEVRSVKLRIMGRYVTIANVGVPCGRYNGVKIIEITRVPWYVTDKELCQLYEIVIVDLGDALTRDYSELIEDRVLS